MRIASHSISTMVPTETELNAQEAAASSSGGPSAVLGATKTGVGQHASQPSSLAPVYGVRRRHGAVSALGPAHS